MNEVTKELWDLFIGSNPYSSPIQGIGIRGDTVVFYLKDEAMGKRLLKQHGIGDEYKGVKVDVIYTGEIVIQG